MAISPQLSSVFAECAKAVLQTPNDYCTKTETLSLLAKMKTLAAQGDAIAQYRLAKAYPKNSSPYLKWLQVSAQQGLTNALLTLAQAYCEQGQYTRSAQCVIKILASNDSFIKTEAKNLLKQNCFLKEEVSKQMVKSGLSRTKFYRFFAQENKSLANEAPHCSRHSTLC